MCGIVAYIGTDAAYSVLINGLRKLEYRGYDSAGVALMQDNNIIMYKKKGRVDELDQYCAGKDTHGTAGIAPDLMQIPARHKTPVRPPKTENPRRNHGILKPYR